MVIRDTVCGPNAYILENYALSKRNSQNDLKLMGNSKLADEGFYFKLLKIKSSIIAYEFKIFKRWKTRNEIEFLRYRLMSIALIGCCTGEKSFSQK